MINKFSIYKLNYIELHAVDHCNLNCKGCSHFCPLINDKIFYDPSLIGMDFQALSRRINILNIRILGGEPLLHPELPDIFKLVRKAYPNAYIYVVTNGILIPSMNEAFWKSIRDNRIQIDLTKYNAFHKTDKIEVECKNKGYKFRVTPCDSFSAWITTEPQFNLIHQIYTNCYVNMCNMVHEGRIHRCAMSLFIKYFNNAFNTTIPLDPGIDIYNLAYIDNIFLDKYFNSPFATCAYCTFPNVRKFDWRPSSNEKSEWLAK